MDGRIAILGGYIATATYCQTVNVYDPVGASWAALPSLNPPARSDLVGATGADGRLYAIGGYDGQHLQIVEAYRIGSPAWVPVATVATVRDVAVAVTIRDGRILVLGGKTSTTVSTATAEAYGPHLALSSASGAPGTTFVASGQNFAANAAARIYFDGVPVELAQTGADGTLAGAIVIVPPLGSGMHAVAVEDAHSLYPVTLPFAVE